MEEDMDTMEDVEEEEMIPTSDLSHTLLDSSDSDSLSSLEETQIPMNTILQNKEEREEEEEEEGEEEKSEKQKYSTQFKAPGSELLRLRDTFVANFSSPQNDCYIFQVKQQQKQPSSSSSSSNEKIVISSSNNILKVFGKELGLEREVKIHSNTINEFFFEDEERSDILVSCSDDKSIKWTDLRISPQNDSTIRFIKKEEEIYSVCQNPKNQYLYAAAVGSSVLQWDVRKNSRPISTYSTHTQDVTKVRYHPLNSELHSVSVDGLVCSYDPTILNEDDSLLSVTNLDQSISNLTFCGDQGQYSCCLTHTESLYLFSSIDGSMIREYGDVRKYLRDKYSLVVDYLIDCIYLPIQNKIWLMSGNISGEFQVSEVLPDNILPLCALSGGHRSIIRAAFWDQRYSCMLTGGEDSRLCLWSSPSSPFFYQSPWTSLTPSSKKMTLEEDPNTIPTRKFKPY